MSEELRALHEGENGGSPCHACYPRKLTEAKCDYCGKTITDAMELARWEVHERSFDYSYFHCSAGWMDPYPPECAECSARVVEGPLLPE